MFLEKMFIVIDANNVCEQRDDNKPGSSQTSCETTLVADPLAQSGFAVINFTWI